MREGSKGRSHDLRTWLVGGVLLSVAFAVTVALFASTVVGAPVGIVNAHPVAVCTQLLRLVRSSVLAVG